MSVYLSSFAFDAGFSTHAEVATELSFGPPPHHTAEPRNVIAQRPPNALIVDAVVGVVNDDAHTFDLCPWELSGASNQLGRQLRRHIADPANNCLAR